MGEGNKTFGQESMSILPGLNQIQPAEQDPLNGLPPLFDVNDSSNPEKKPEKKQPKKKDKPD